MMSPNLKLV